MKLKLEKNDDYCISFQNYSLFSIEPKNLNQYCHHCNTIPFPSAKNFYTSEGCFFHLKCIEEIFHKWYDETESFTQSIEDYSTECKKCQKPVHFISFLKESSQTLTLKNFKIMVEKKTLCCFCEETKIDLTAEMIQQGLYQNLHCPSCWVRVRYCGKCKNCVYSNTSGFNFGFWSVSNEVKCFACWSHLASTLKSQNDQRGDEILKDVLVDTDIKCIACKEKGKVRYRGRMICDHDDHSQVCVECYNENQCCICNHKMQINVAGIWR